MYYHATNSQDIGTQMGSGFPSSNAVNVNKFFCFHWAESKAVNVNKFFAFIGQSRDWCRHRAGLAVLTNTPKHSQQPQWKYAVHDGSCSPSWFPYDMCKSFRIQEYLYSIYVLCESNHTTRYTGIYYPGTITTIIHDVSNCVHGVRGNKTQPQMESSTLITRVQNVERNPIRW